VMPRFDGSGPAGRGPMTGWGRGNCIVPVRGWAARAGVQRVPSRRIVRGFRRPPLREEIASLRNQINRSRRQLEK
jgi:hypothetical protein